MLRYHELMARAPMTRKGYLELQQEFDQLWNVTRPDVVRRVADAAAEGDRSENAEYIYGRKRMREIDARVRYLSQLLDQPIVIDIEKLSGDRVAFGATVDLWAEDGQRVSWMIVGEAEARPERGTISYRSPIAQALLGKSVGDEVSVRLPDGSATYEIAGVRFVERSD